MSKVKSVTRLLISTASITTALCASPMSAAKAEESPPIAVPPKIDEQKFSWSWDIQDRVMYSSSNIGASHEYDFFQQRVRLGVTLESPEKIGAYTQIEYRGVFGAANGYNVNNAPFNRLNARGARYGYIFTPLYGGQVQVGLVPLNDQIHQTLFSADWDFNVGGITYVSEMGSFSYRVAALRYIDATDLAQAGVKTASPPDKDQNIFVADFNYQASERTKFGLHYYGLFGAICQTAACTTTSPGPVDSDFTNQEQSWVAATGKLENDFLPVDLFYVYNKGRFGSIENEGHLGFVEVKKDSGVVDVSLLLAMSTGASANASRRERGTGYETITDLKGTAGYWGYSHIFTASGPSDVNGYLISPSNKGFGLQTAQLKIGTSISDKSKVHAYGGFFSSASEMTNSTGARFGTELGTEFGFMATHNFGRGLNWEFGYADAQLGTAGRNIYQQNNASHVFQFFSRFQLEI